MNKSKERGSEQRRNSTNDGWKIPFRKPENRNLGSPLVVDMLSDRVSSLNFPKTLEQKQRTRPSKNVVYTNDTFGFNAVTSSQPDARITVAESIKPKQSTSQKKPQKLQKQQVLPMSPTVISPIRKRHCVKEQRSSSHEESISTQQQHAITRKSQVYCIRNVVIVIMESKSRLCFTGKLLVKVLYGAVEIYGYILNRSTEATEVYSPRGYSNVSIETSEALTEDSLEDVWTALVARGITRDSESKLRMSIDNVQPGTAILVLQNFENGLTRFLRTHFPSFRLFPSINNPCYYSWMNPKRAEIMLQASLHLEQDDDHNYRRLIASSCITTDITEKMLNSWRANEWSCTLIAGGKGVGKSTSVRYLINSLLRTSGKVVLVDVDPGQAECTPAGCVSYSLIEEPLMGPNFTHLKMPVYQLYLDDINVARCVTRYLEGVKMLIERLQRCPVLSRLPIVVNTMGFTYDLGWDIAMFTIKLIRPTIILQIMSSRKKNYQNYLSAEVVNKQVKHIYHFSATGILGNSKMILSQTMIFHNRNARGCVATRLSSIGTSRASTTCAYFSLRQKCVRTNGTWSHISSENSS